jgi:hypothetical protein
MTGVGSYLRRMASSPLSYGAWAILVVATLAATYPMDPYLFGFTALGLAWLTGAVTIVAVGALALWGWDWTWPRRLLIVGAVATSITAVARALAVLKTFRWN